MSRGEFAVGLIGVGVMGSAIAARLLEQGTTVHLCDADPTKLAPLIAKGATAERSAAQLARRVETVITSLNTATIVEAVVFGENGVAAGASPGKLLIDMSSIDPKATADMARRLEETTGMAWVDSPLSGGAPAALKGSLTLMAVVTPTMWSAPRRCCGTSRAI
jgi:2-hydroxy-3-oxopropionate reductase